MNDSLLLATIGGFSLNILQLLEYSKLSKTERPDFKDWLFWLPYIVWPILAYFLAFAYDKSGIKLSPILALNVGLSAPLILKAMIQANPMRPNSIDPGKGA
jgi:hypothetical protein